MKILFGIQFCMLLMVTTICSTPALAHKVRVFAWQEGETVYAEAKFSGGNPAKNVAVVIEDSSTHQRLLSGKTDEKGNFSFTVPSPPPKSLLVIVDGGDGHRNTWTHTIETEDESITAKEPTPSPAPVNIKHAQPAETQATISNIDMEQLTTILETVIDKKLSPIKKTLAQSVDRGPSLQDILGGIGYIFGLAGIAAYFKSKKQ